MKATVKVHNCELSFSDADVVNPGDFIPRGEYNPHNVRPWLLHDHGFPVAVVFAESLQDALDIARLGNASEPFDIESLGYVELSNPPFSFAAMFAAGECRAISAHFAPHP